MDTKKSPPPIKKEQVNEQIFTKRSGTTDKGKDYEDYNVANIAMDLVNDKEITDFNISSNDADFGAFDDIVVETQKENGTEIYALQLKHSDRGNLSIAHLTQAKGDFSIKKYLSSWETLTSTNTKFLLCTNLKFKFQKSIKIYLHDEDFPITLTQIDSNNVLKISQKTNYCYRFSFVGDEDSNEYCPEVLLYKRFFDNFFLYTDQENIDSLKRNVIERFKTSFCGNEDECDQYVKLVKEWSLKEGKKEKLNKKSMQLAIALTIFSSRIKPLSFNHNNDVEEAETVRRKILRDAIAVFDVSFFNKKSYNKLKTLWSDSKRELKDLKLINKLRSKYQLASIYISDIDKADSATLSILLWLIDKSPLILTQDSSVQKAMELCIGKKFILLHKNDFDNSCLEAISGFKSLSDLKANTSEYNQLVQNFKCSLQGKGEICFENLIIDNEELLSVLKTDDLLEMCKGQCRIGETKENLSEPYIERFLLKNAIDFNILENISKDSVVILDSVSQLKDLENKLRKHNLININDYLNLEKDKKLQTDLCGSGTIVFSENRCQYSEFQEICNNENVKHCHQFSVRDNGNLEWIRSIGDVTDVQKYRLSEYYPIPERDLSSSRFQNNINLLISDPGMGKSELTKSFKINCFPECFTVIIDPKEVYSFVRNKSKVCADTFRKFLLDKKYETLSERDKAIFRIFLDKNKIIYVWDALDELLDKHRDVVIDIIVELSKNSVQWVTSRCHLQDLLQSKFNVLPLTLNKFDKNEQKNYIRKRLSGDDDADDDDDDDEDADDADEDDADDDDPIESTETIIKKIEDSFVLIEHKDILGIPLQLFMLTELFRQNRNKYLELLNNFFVLTDLYKYFIKEKFNILYREKLGIIATTGPAEVSVLSQKEQILEEYSTAALRLLFPETILSELGIQYKQNIEVIQQTHTNIGLVTELTDQVPRFLHNSFAEYLAARFFAKNLEQTQSLVHVMFDSKYTNVRFFLDLLLAKNSKAHVAILYKNFNFIETCDIEALRSIDSGGRSVLHLACSWGQRYLELNVKCNGNTYVIDDEDQIKTVLDNQEYLKTIDRLIEKCDISRIDEIYKITPEEYARRTTCMGAEMRIMMKEATDISIMDVDHIINLLYYSAHYGYYDKFTFFYEIIEKKTLEPEGKQIHSTVINVENIIEMTLLSVAATMGHDEIVEFLLQKGTDINHVDAHGFSPLYSASSTGNYETVKCLVKAGADCNLASRNGVIPLSEASVKGHYNIVKYLVKVGADINSRNTYGNTPLNRASMSRKCKIAECLVEAGADANLANTDGFMPIHAAAESGSCRIVECLLEAGSDVNLANEDGDSPLHIASTTGCLEMVEFLVEKGARIDLLNRDGETALHLASKRGYVKIVEFLFSKGADINFALHAASANGHYEIVEFLIKNGADIHLPGNFDFTPLNEASSNGHIKIVEFLVKLGADINVPNRYGAMPLNTASANGHIETVEFLAGNGGNINLAEKSGDTPLTLACCNGHHKVVDFLVEAGADINLADKYGGNLLNIASREGHEKVVEVLVKAGSDVNLPDKNGLRPCNTASNYGRYKIFEFLVKAGADSNLASIDGVTPLQGACERGHYEMVEFLVKRGEDINLAGKDSVTPLHAAFANEWYQIVQFLLEAGADVNLADKDGLTPLHAACLRGHYKSFNTLLKAGADINIANKDGLTPLKAAYSRERFNMVVTLIKAGVDGINVPNEDGDTLLHIVCKKGQHKVFRSLIEAAADINLANNNDVTPLYAASVNGRDEMVEILVKEGVDLNRAENHGFTPLHAASAVGFDKITQFLVEAGADVNLRSETYGTPLKAAARNGHYKIVEFLLRKGADINLASKSGLTPLIAAAWNGHYEIVKFLVDEGADIHLDMNGLTPLKAASERGYDKIVEFLVEAGADINRADRECGTPLHAACEHGRYKVVEFLVEAGADTNVVNKFGDSALDVASKQGYDEIVELLVNRDATKRGNIPRQTTSKTLPKS